MRYITLFLLLAILGACGELEEKPFMAYVKQNDRITKIGSDPISLNAQPFQIIFTLSEYDTTAMQSIIVEAIGEGDPAQSTDEANPRKLPAQGSSHQYQYLQLEDGTYETNFSKAEHKMGQLLLELHVDSVGSQALGDLAGQSFRYLVVPDLTPIQAEPISISLSF